MPMTTCCPRCAATFVVTPAQLQARGGRVRCGVCAAVFDARACAVAPLETATGIRPESASESAPEFAANPAPAVPLVAAPPAVLRARGQRVEPVLGDVADTAHVSTPIVADPLARIAAPAVALDDDLDLDDDDADAALPGRTTRVLVTLAILAALLALAGQALWLWRAELAAAVPPLRPVLQSLCRPLGCTVGYLRHPDRLAITASALQTEAAAPSARQPGADTATARATRLRLTATLHNRHSQPQHWPALMLELRDFADTVVVRRTLMPEDYLSPDAAAQPLAAGASVPLSVSFTVTGVTDVNGYQVRPFYP